MDAVIYGKAAGYSLRQEDAKRAASSKVEEEKANVFLFDFTSDELFDLEYAVHNLIEDKNNFDNAEEDFSETIARYEKLLAKIDGFLRQSLQENKINKGIDTECFYIEDGEVREATLRKFDLYIETTTRPSGIGPKYYATTITKNFDAEYDDDGNQVAPERTEDVWVLAKWATWAGPEKVIKEFENEEEAKAAAERIYVSEILDNNEMLLFLSREQAEAALADNVLVNEEKTPEP